MTTNYIEVTFRTDVDAGEIMAMLQNGEEVGCWEDAGTVHMFWPEAQWSPDALQDLRQVLALHGVDPEAAGLKVAAVPDKDWNATWAASLTPIRLGQRLRIRQSWHPPDSAFQGIELVIDPKRAFGTGYHATTQLVVEWLEKTIQGGERLLDVGTGSGILAMTAIRLGAASALGIDNDAVAIECAREYARVNGFGPELELRVGSFDDAAAKKDAGAKRDAGAEPFDVVVANIDGKTLPQLCPLLPRLLRPGAIACFSGLQEHDLEAITAALHQAGLVVKDRSSREEWLALAIARER